MGYFPKNGLIAAIFLSYTIGFTTPSFGQSLPNSKNIPQAFQITALESLAIQNVITDQITAFKKNDFERAYSHADPSIKTIFGSVERFASMVKNGYPALFNPKHYSYTKNIKVEKDFLQELIVTDKAGKAWKAIYILAPQEDGIWKIKGVTIKPSKGSAT